MNKFKSILSLLLAGALLAGSLSMLAGCDSSDSVDDSEDKESSSNSGTGTINGSNGGSGSDSNKKKSTYDGAWLWIGNDGELDTDCLTEEPQLLWISGNSVEIYVYDEDKEDFITIVDYFADNYGDDYTYTAEYVFDSKTGAITVTETMGYDGETETNTVTGALKVDGYNAVLESDDGEEAMLYWISAQSPEKLKIGLLDEGVWYTEDRKYGLAVEGDDLGAMAILVQFASTDNWVDEWYEDGDNVASYLMMYALVISDTMICMTVDPDGDYEIAVLGCSLKKDQLTINDLDSMRMLDFEDEETEVKFSSSSLTFQYSGEID